MDVPSLVGSKLGGYEVVRLLGQGGMGAVYEGQNSRINRRAAIKVLLPEFVTRPDIVSRFLNEARAVNAINHPGVVPVSEAETSPDGSLYLVMEYVDGETLSSRLQRAGGRLSEAEVISICWQLADVLAAAHGKGIVHRDLKPGNVMLVADPTGISGERVKLLDFGIAKLSTDLHQQGEDVRTRTGQLLGTAGYMSPEQLNGTQKIDGQSDVYSLGIMMFRMLAGRLPFSSQGGDVGMVAMHLFMPAPPLSEFLPGAPAWLETLLGQMLAKGAAERPTIVEVRARLREMLAGTSSPVLTVRTPTVPPPQTPQPAAAAPPSGQLADSRPSQPGSLTGATGQADRRTSVLTTPRRVPVYALGGISLALAAAVGIGFVVRSGQGPKATAGAASGAAASGSDSATSADKTAQGPNAATVAPPPTADVGSAAVAAPKSESVGKSSAASVLKPSGKPSSDAKTDKGKAKNAGTARPKQKPSRETSIID